MSDLTDVAVVGAGPCGIAVGAAAATAGLEATLYDKGCITNSLVNYPYYMTFFSTARKLEIGDVPFTIADSKPTRREALGYYRRVVQYYDLDVRQYEEVASIEGQKGTSYCKPGRAREQRTLFGPKRSWSRRGDSTNRTIWAYPERNSPR